MTKANAARKSLILVPALVSGEDVAVIYTDRDGVVSGRTIQVLSIEKCQNGETIVRVWDRNRERPRSLRLDRINGLNGVLFG